MLTWDVFNRVFFLKALEYGTGFVVDVEGRQYLVSASHLFDEVVDEVKLHLENKWISFKPKIVGRSRGGSDVIVLAFDKRLPVSGSVELSAKGLSVSQDVYLLGFPYKGGVPSGALPGRQMPFVKKGMLAGFEAGADDSIEALLIDAYSNVGLSGGPVVFRAPCGNLQIGGLVSKYRLEEEPIRCGRTGEETGDVVRLNTGIVVAPFAALITGMIERNPIGCC